MTDSHYTPPTSLRWPVELKAELEKLAKDEDRSLNSYVVHVMRQHVAKLKSKKA